MIPWWRPCPSKIHKWSRIHFYQMISCYHENHIPSFSLAFPLFQSAKSKKTTATLSARFRTPLRTQFRSATPKLQPHFRMPTQKSSLERWSCSQVRSSRSLPCDFQAVKQARRKGDEQSSYRRLKQKKKLIPAKFHNQKNDKEKKRTISNFFERENI